MSEEGFREILDKVDTEFAVSLTQELVRVPSVVGAEGPVAEALAGALARLGIGSVWKEEVEPGRSNVLWQVEGSRPGPRFLFTGHMDTKPVCEGWTRDPFAAERDGSRVYGHGIMDMKAGLACQVAAMKAIIEAGVEFAGTLTFAAVADHMGAQGGSIALFRRHKFAYAVLGELSDMQIYVAHRGRYYFDISTIGRSAHTCHKDKSINAIEKMMPIVDRISAIRHYPDIDPVVRDLVGAELHIAVGRIYGGLFPGGPSMIPDRCTIRVDTRPQPGVPVEAVRALLEQAVGEAHARDPEIRAEIVLADAKDSFMVPVDAPLVGYIKNAWSRVMGRPAVVRGASWLGDTASFGRLVETVIFGPGGEPVYTPDEYLEIDDIERAAQINALTAIQALAPGAQPRDG
jgi:acetylornithine deacetylase/succinyl-diaminopimelate desuccinylase-like protein